jgi:hypothetical protein
MLLLLLLLLLWLPRAPTLYASSQGLAVGTAAQRAGAVICSPGLPGHPSLQLLVVEAQGSHLVE